MPAIALPAPVMAFAIEPKTKGDEDKVFTALRRLQEEDPTIDLHRDEQTGEQIVAGLSQIHVEVVIARLRERFGAEVELHPPRVPYQETIRAERESARPPQEAERRPWPVRRLPHRDRAAAGRRGLRVRQRDQRRRDPRRLHPRGRERRRGGDAARCRRRLPGQGRARARCSTAPTTRSTPPRWRSRRPARSRCARRWRPPARCCWSRSCTSTVSVPGGRGRRRDRRPQQPSRASAGDGAGRRA